MYSHVYKGVLKHLVSGSFSRSGGVSLAVRGCGLKRFLPPIILCVYMWTCLCIVRSSFKMHIHTLVHTCILPKLTQPGCHTPNHDYKLKCEELFFGFAFYTCTLFFLSWLPQDDGTPEYFLSCHKSGLHTLPRGALVQERRSKQTQIEPRICA